MDQAVKDGIYLAVVIVIAIFVIRIFMAFGVFILVAALAYYIYKRFIKKDDDIYRM